MALISRTYQQNPKEKKFEGKRNVLAERISTIFAVLSSRDPNMPEDIAPAPENQYSTRRGNPRPEFFSSISGLWYVNPEYQQAVKDSHILAEHDFLIKSVIDKLARAVSEPETTAEFADGPHKERCEEIARNLFTRISWQKKKDQFVRALLLEGGLSTEISVSSDRRGIDDLAYIRHNGVVPLTDRFGKIVDPKKAYEYRDPETNRLLTIFRSWQVAEVNFVEAKNHNRGVPYLQAVRALLKQLNLLTKGSVQKFVLESASVEHINLPEAKDWDEVEEFKENTEHFLGANPGMMLRRVVTKGPVDFDRLTVEGNGVTSIDPHLLFLDLLFLSFGVPKEIFGFRAETMIRDMVTVSNNIYYELLRKIDKCLHTVLERALFVELGIQGFEPSSVPFKIRGGKFEPMRTYDLKPEALQSGSITPNEIRRASQLPRQDGDLAELFDTPGVVITPKMALMIAQGADWRTFDPNELFPLKRSGGKAGQTDDPQDIGAGIDSNED